MRPKYSSRLSFRLPLFAVCFVQMSGMAQAGVHTWIGSLNGQNNYWSVPTNWEGGVPTSNEPGGTVIVFNSGVTSEANIPGLVVDRVVFNLSGSTLKGAFSIRGGGFTSNIQDTTGVSKLLATITAADNTIVIVEPKAGVMYLSAVAGATNLRKIGAGELNLTSSPNRTGGTLVEEGTMNCTNIVENEISVGFRSGSRGTAVLKMLPDASGRTGFPDTCMVTVNFTGILDMNHLSDTIGSLYIAGGSVINMGPVTEVLGQTTFKGGTLSGSGKFLPTGNISCIADANAIHSDIELNGPRIFIVENAPADLELSGVISGPGDLIKDGEGNILFNGTGRNTYTGKTMITAGRLTLDSPGLPIPGDLVVGDVEGLGIHPAIMQLQTGQIADTANVTVNRKGFVSLTKNERIASLNIIDGSVYLLGGVLTLEEVDALSMTGGVIFSVDGVLRPLGNSVFTSSATRSAEIRTKVRLDATRVFRVNDGPIGVDLNVSGVIEDLATGAGVIKTGEGAMVFSGTNNYLGDTNVNEGSLFILGDNSKSTVRVASGSTFGGSGISGPIIAKKEPGPSPALWTAPARLKRNQRICPVAPWTC